ncbi:hypothetical protein ACIQFZ_40055 [Streptomyces sp. NPDC093064]|uniref:hypothetical protein n=1 Tax=Streptomyces sp. NPDC093064 TaxID=3366020 RepID=UPI0038050080
MRRSTIWTRRFGAAALTASAVTTFLPVIRYGAPPPRFDVYVALVVALLCGLGWVAATARAPLAKPTVVPASRTDDAAPVPPRTPGPSLAARGSVLAGALAVVAVGSLLIQAQRPDGTQARTVRAIQAAGARVTTGTIAEVTRADASNVSKSGAGKGSTTPESQHFHYVWLTVELPDGTRLRVNRGIVDGRPFRDEKVDVLYAPGRPELGGWVDESADVSVYGRTWGPPLTIPVLVPFGVALFVGFAYAAMLLPAATAREGVRGTGPGARLLLVAAYTVVAATLLPVLNGTNSHLGGYLPVLAAIGAGVLAARTIVRA